jgi:hypothetical protein
MTEVWAALNNLTGSSIAEPPLLSMVSSGAKRLSDNLAVVMNNCIVSGDLGAAVSAFFEMAKELPQAAAALMDLLYVKVACALETAYVELSDQSLVQGRFNSSSSNSSSSSRGMRRAKGLAVPPYHKQFLADHGITWSAADTPQLAFVHNLVVLQSEILAAYRGSSNTARTAAVLQQQQQQQGQGSAGSGAAEWRQLVSTGLLPPVTPEQLLLVLEAALLQPDVALTYALRLWGDTVTALADLGCLEMAVDVLLQPALHLLGPAAANSLTYMRSHAQHGKGCVCVCHAPAATDTIPAAATASARSRVWCCIFGSRSCTHCSLPWGCKTVSLQLSN